MSTSNPIIATTISAGSSLLSLFVARLFAIDRRHRRSTGQSRATIMFWAWIAMAVADLVHAADAAVDLLMPYCSDVPVEMGANRDWDIPCTQNVIRVTAYLLERFLVPVCPAVFVHMVSGLADEFSGARKRAHYIRTGLHFVLVLLTFLGFVTFDIPRVNAVIVDTRPQHQQQQLSSFTMACAFLEPWGSPLNQTWGIYLVGLGVGSILSAYHFLKSAVKRIPPSVMHRPQSIRSPLGSSFLAFGRRYSMQTLATASQRGGGRNGISSTTATPAPKSGAAAAATSAYGRGLRHAIWRLRVLMGIFTLSLALTVVLVLCDDKFVMPPLYFSISWTNCRIGLACFSIALRELRTIMVLRRQIPNVDAGTLATQWTGVHALTSSASPGDASAPPVNGAVETIYWNPVQSVDENPAAAAGEGPEFMLASVKPGDTANRACRLVKTVEVEEEESEPGP
ncbi:hypothetical protein BC828DRAFT_379722 [Blastocladiella britannica]|nr:hypothetical protein BC828DRAFT_379722 [Blastocladiella britannica]